MTSKEETNKPPGFVVEDILWRNLERIGTDAQTKWVVLNLDALHREILQAITVAVAEEHRACVEIARNPNIAPYTVGARLGEDTIPLMMREHLAQAIEARGVKP